MNDFRLFQEMTMVVVGVNAVWLYATGHWIGGTVLLIYYALLLNATWGER